MKWLTLLILCTAVQAKTYYSNDVRNAALSEHGNIVVGSIWQNLGWPVKESPKFEPVPDPAPQPMPTPAKDIVITPKPKPTPKKLSKGQLAIQEMLKKNRKRIQRRAQKPTRESEKPLTIKEQYLKNLDNLKRKNQGTLTSWKSQRDNTLMRCKLKQKEFLNQLNDFKKATFNFESAGIPVGPSKLKKPLVAPIKNKFHVIPGAFDISIKNQGKRPTCAAFAGVRAVETLLSAHGNQKDLSEQYLYWSAKPDCQSSPCSNRGSWVSKPFKKSSRNSSPDIPLENSCPYSEFDRPSNQTHIPLGMGCRQGSVQVKDYQRIETLDEIVNSLKVNQPVVAGFKLTPNFYKNNGLVTYLNSKSGGQMNEHAGGHAILLIGFIKLPPELQNRGEGKLCFLAANSWGEGWGQGGYSCLTERWVRQHRIKNAFMALKSVKIK